MQGHRELDRILSTGEAGSAVLARGLALVHLASQRGGADVRELSEGTGIALSTTYRLVNQLVDSGFLMEVEGQLHLGPALFAVSSAEVPHLVDLVRPVLRHLAHLTGMNALLTVRANTLSLCLDVAAPRGSAKASFRIGQTRTLHAGASATPLLAFADRLTIERVIASPLRRYTSRTPDEEMLRRKLEDVRNQGYDLTEGEVQASWSALGMPVLLRGQPVCCLSLAGPTSMFGHHETYRSLLEDATERLASTMTNQPTDMPWWTPTDHTGAQNS